MLSVFLPLAFIRLIFLRPLLIVLLRDLHARLLIGLYPAFMSDFSGAFALWSTFSFGFDIELSLYTERPDCRQV